MKIFHHHHHLSGYSLIEIMIVVFAIGLITSIAVPSYLKARSRSQATACRESQEKMQRAIVRWALDNGKSADDVPLTEDLVGYQLYLKTTPACPIKSEPEGGGKKRSTPIEPVSFDQKVVCPIEPVIAQHDRENAI